MHCLRVGHLRCIIALSVADGNNYEKLKDALLRTFDMTERGLRNKFLNDRL